MLSSFRRCTLHFDWAPVLELSFCVFVCAVRASRHFGVFHDGAPGGKGLRVILSEPCGMFYLIIFFFCFGARMCCVKLTMGFFFQCLIKIIVRARALLGLIIAGSP